MSIDQHYDRNGLAVLSRDECFGLLEQSVVGRVGLTVKALPVVLPVNFALIDGDIVFRTSRGSKLQAATDRQVVCFQADGIDAVTRTGWSVLVTGIAEVVDEDRLARVQSLSLQSWAPVALDCYVIIHSKLVSGRRIVANGHRWPV